MNGSLNPLTLAAILQGQGQQQPGTWPPPAPPISTSQPPQADPTSQLGQGVPQQFAFLNPGQQPSSPLAQALQPKAAAPVAPDAAAGGMSWFSKMMPWLAAAQFVGQASDQPVTIGGGRGGGYSLPSGGLL